MEDRFGLETLAFKKVRLGHPRALIRDMQGQRVAQPQCALAFDPGGDPAHTSGGRFERFPMARFRRLNCLGGKDTRPVLHVDGQGHPVLRLQS